MGSRYNGAKNYYKSQTIVQQGVLRASTKTLDLMSGAVARFQQTLTHLTDISRLQQAIEDQPSEELDLAPLVEDVRLDILPEVTAAQATARSAKLAGHSLLSARYQSKSRDKVPILTPLGGKRIMAEYAFRCAVDTEASEDTFFTGEPAYYLLFYCWAVGE